MLTPAIPQLRARTSDEGTMNDTPPVMWRSAALEVMDTIASGSVQLLPSGEVQVVVPRDHWHAFQRMRGSAAEVEARAYARAHRDKHPAGGPRRRA
jgi:hypothetical protein